MNNIHHNVKGNGFTLIEIIASIAILGMVIAVFLPIFPQIMSWNNKTEQALVSGNLLEQAVEDIKQDSQKLLEGVDVGNCSNPTSIQTDLPTYTVNNVEFLVDVKVCQSEVEAQTGLYRTNIIISSSDGFQSESYTYIQGDPNE